MMGSVRAGSAIAGSAIAGSAFAAWERPVRSLAEFDELGLASAATEAVQPLAREHLLELIHYSALAPSSHNSVPQLYQLDVSTSAVDVLLDRDRVLKASDPTGKQALISIGCALENLETAAKAYGVASEWMANPAPEPLPLDLDAKPRELLVGRVRLGRVASSSAASPDEAERQSMLRALIDRRSLRVEFDPSVPLPDHVRAGLEQCATSSPTVSFRLFTSTGDRFHWGKLDELAMKNKLEQRVFREELGRSMLPNDDVIAPRGMRGREFGFDDRRAVELSAQLRGEGQLPPDQLAMLARGGRIGMQSSAAVCALAAPDTLASVVELGRIYQRCALLAWRSGIAHAVHTAVCEVPHVRSMCRATLMAGTGGPSVIFRLGLPLVSSDWSRPHSSRPAVADLTIRG